MRTARLLGLTGDGKHLLVATEDGLEIAIPADDRLRAALRGDVPRLGQLEIEMDSALRPRDIQARIRAGESPEDVARAAGVPVERIDAFAAPVIAERDHVAGLAQLHPVRRRGETTSHRSLRLAVAEALAGRSIGADAATWDAWKVEDRRWRVAVRYRSGSAEHEAFFLYDTAGRFSVAENEEARWLIGDASTAHGPQPGRRPAQRPTSAGPVDDELAIVRALQSGDADDEQADTAPASGPEAAQEPTGRAPEEGAEDDLTDAYHPGELAEVDGVYEIVTVEGEDTDVLYDMLSSFDEDSVRIYAGLMGSDDDRVEPRVAPLTPPVAEPAGEPEEGSDEPAATDEATTDAGAGDAGGASDAGLAAGVDEGSTGPAADADAPAAEEPEQLTLIEHEADAAAPPADAPKPKRNRRRAQVPSWDEIMFGGPTPREDGDA